MRLDDTIAAISSAVGPAARMIVRASGPQSPDILHNICPDSPPAPAAVRASLRCERLFIPAWVYRFPANHSYTGDDLFELHIPGNPLLAMILLRRLIALGARAAEPGEFTARAYFNGRLDLSQAEGVAAVVAAANQAELDAGRRLMAGELSRRLRPMMDDLSQTLALIEAEIDFSDQEVRFLSAEEVDRRLRDVNGELENLLQNSARLSRLSHEPRLVLAGRPNAGKSTLLNALSQSARALVSPVAGTTRDALSAAVVLDRGIIRLVDVAGLEEIESNDPIESKMRERALRELESADAVILIVDASDVRPPLELPRKPDLMVISKIDLRPGVNQLFFPSSGTPGEGQGGGLGPAKEQGRLVERKPPPRSSPGVPEEEASTSRSWGITGRSSVALSAMENIGMDDLRRELDILAFGKIGGAELALTARHVRAIHAARDCVPRAMQSGAAELIAAELRHGLDSLGQVLGDVSPDDILGRIFSTFCIGK